MNDEKLTQQKLEAYLWGCAEYLRNKIDAGDYKMYIFPMLFYNKPLIILNKKAFKIHYYRKDRICY